MKLKIISLVAIAAAAVGSSPATAGGWQCVTYARTITDVSIRGNANTWWGQAAGRYDRGTNPEPGAVLAFRSAPGMRAGHVAVVRQIIGPREVALDHANWSRRGGVEHDARAIDVSDAGDWSAVKVTYGHAMGTRTNPTYGFIYPHALATFAKADPKPERGPLIDGDVLALASAELDGGR